MEAVPIEYIWHYNPVTGRVAGAQQNYGQRINILHANRKLYNRMQQVQRERNALLTVQGLQTLTGGSYMHYVPTTFNTVDLEDCRGGSESMLEALEEAIERDKVKADSAGAIQNNIDTLVAAAEEAKDKAAELLTTQKFVKQFPPVVYNNPFSGPNFPFEFNPLYNPNGNQFTSVSPLHLTGGYVSYAGQYPKLQGGALVIKGQNPVLG